MLGLFREWLVRSRILRDERKLQKQDDPHVKQYVADRILAGKHAFDGGDRQTALRIWQEVRSHYPHATMRSRDGLYLLTALQRFDEADSMMQEGYKRYPRDPFYLEGAAFVAKKRGDREEAVRRYAVLRKKFPRIVNGYTHAIDPLIELGRLDEADKVLSIIAVNNHELSIATQYAKLAMTRKDWPAALKRWQGVRHATAVLGVAQCLRESGRLGEAEELVVDTLRHPRLDALTFRMELALIAEARADWAQAAMLWDDVRMSAPSMLDGYRRASLAFAKCGKASEAEKVLHEATQRFPSEPQPWIDYARFAENRGDTAAATARWEQFRIKFPDHSET